MDDDQGEQVSRKLLYDLHLLVQLTDVPSWMLSLIVGRREGFVSHMTVREAVYRRARSRADYS